MDNARAKGHSLRMHCMKCLFLYPGVFNIMTNLVLVCYFGGLVDTEVCCHKINMHTKEKHSIWKGTGHFFLPILQCCFRLLHDKTSHTRLC